MRKETVHQDKEENFASWKKLSALNKVLLLEKTVLENNVEKAEKVIDACKPFEFTARALGFACRFCGTEMVKLLVEKGKATFDFDKKGCLQSKYSISENTKYSWYGYAKFELMPIVDSIRNLRLFGDLRNTSDVATENFEREPQPESVRLENVRYISGVKKLKEYTGQMLYYAIMNGKDAFVKVIRDNGGNLDSEHIDFFKDPNTYVSERNNFVYVLSTMDAGRMEITVNTLLDLLQDTGNRLKVVPSFLKEFLRGNAKMFTRVLTEGDCGKINESKLLNEALECGSTEIFALLLEKGYAKNISLRDKLIERANALGKTEHLAALLDYKNRTANLEEEAAQKQAKEMRELMAAPDSVQQLKKKWSYKKLEDGTLVITSYKGEELEVEIPARIGKTAVTVIGEEAFSPTAGQEMSVPKVKNAEIRRQITSVHIPNSVTTISAGTFYGCTGLTSISIPDSVTEIGGGAFSNTAWYQNQPKGCVYAGKVVIGLKETTEAVIREGTVAIGGRAFADCSSLTKVNIPHGVTEIGFGAFCGCTGLTEIIMPKGVMAIGSRAFSGCTSLTSITIPDGVMKIGWSVFHGCTGLTEITIPDGVTEIGSGIFYDCTALEKVKLPKQLKADFDETQLRNRLALNKDVVIE